MSQTFLSAVIITFNEEKNIERCLQSLIGVVDEVVVVDSFSTDATHTICERYNVRWIQNPFEGYAQQKNFALAQTKFDYVLALDADEALSVELKQSILFLKENGGLQQAYSFNRLNSYCGQWIHHCGWYPDCKIRLWDKTKGDWGSQQIHEKVELYEDSTKIIQLKGDLLHYSYYTVDEHLKQGVKYAEWSAQHDFERGKKTNLLKLIVKPVFNFFRNYILKLGFLDGYYGWVICVNTAYANFFKTLKLYELQNNTKSFNQKH